MKTAISIGAVFLLSLAAIGAEAQKKGTVVVVGRVLDYSSHGIKERGIPGVSVVAQDDQGQVVGTAQTDASGSYVMQLIRPRQSLSVKHRKIGYKRDPEVWEGKISQDKAVEVYMMKSAVDVAYSASIATAVVEHAKSRDRIEDLLGGRFSSVFKHGVKSAGVGHTPEITETGSNRSLLAEWTRFHSYDPSPAQRAQVRRSVAKIAPSDALLLVKHDIEMIDPALNGKDPQAATEAAQAGGFLESIILEKDSSQLTEDNRAKLTETAELAKAAKLVLSIGVRAGYSFDSAQKQVVVIRNLLISLGVSPDRIRTVFFEGSGCTVEPCQNHFAFSLVEGGRESRKGSDVIRP